MNIVKNKTKDEYMKKFGKQYDNGDLWDFNKSELEDGTIEPNEDIDYWEIEGRYFEAPREEQLVKESKNLKEGKNYIYSCEATTGLSKLKFKKEVENRLSKFNNIKVDIDDFKKSSDSNSVEFEIMSDSKLKEKDIKNALEDDKYIIYGVFVSKLKESMNLKEDLDKDNLVKFIENSIEELKGEDDLKGAYYYKLDSDYAVVIKYEEGYDEEIDDTIIQLKSSPSYAISAGIFVRDSDYFVDAWNMPYLKNGEVIDFDSAVPSDYNAEELADELLENHKYIVDNYELVSDEGEVVEKTKESKNLKEDEDDVLRNVLYNGRRYPIKDKSFLSDKLASYRNEMGLESLATVEFKNGDKYKIYDSGFSNVHSTDACAVKIEESMNLKEDITSIKEKAKEYVKESILDMQMELAQMMMRAIDGYNAEWAAEESSKESEEAEEALDNYVDIIVESLFTYANPDLNESKKLKEDLQNDKEIRGLLKDLNKNIKYILDFPNFDAYTDRIIEEIISKVKDLEELHENNFNKNEGLSESKKLKEDKKVLTNNNTLDLIIEIIKSLVKGEQHGFNSLDKKFSKDLESIYNKIINNEDVVENVKELVSKIEGILNVDLGESKKLKEDVKLTIGLDEYEPWSGAIETWDEIVKAGKVDDLDFLLEEVYPEGLSRTQLNDILWFDSDWVLEQLGLKESEEDLEESKSINNSEIDNTKENNFEGPFEIEYWETEEDRDLGLGEIFIDSYDDLEEAIDMAKRLYDDFAAVEVLDNDGQVAFGLYDEIEEDLEQKDRGHVKRSTKHSTIGKYSRIK